MEEKKLKKERHLTNSEEERILLEEYEQYIPLKNRDENRNRICRETAQKLKGINGLEWTEVQVRTWFINHRKALTKKQNKQEKNVVQIIFPNSGTIPQPMQLNPEVPQNTQPLYMSQIQDTFNQPNPIPSQPSLSFPSYDGCFPDFSLSSVFNCDSALISRQNSSALQPQKDNMTIVPLVQADNNHSTAAQPQQVQTQILNPSQPQKAPAQQQPAEIRFGFSLHKEESKTSIEAPIITFPGASAGTMDRDLYDSTRHQFFVHLQQIFDSIRKSFYTQDPEERLKTQRAFANIIDSLVQVMHDTLQIRPIACIDHNGLFIGHVPMEARQATGAVSNGQIATPMEQRAPGVFVPQTPVKIVTNDTSPFLQAAVSGNITIYRQEMPGLTAVSTTDGGPLVYSYYNETEGSSSIKYNGTDLIPSKSYKFVSLSKSTIMNKDMIFGCAGRPIVTFHLNPPSQVSIIQLPGSVGTAKKVTISVTQDRIYAAADRNLFVGHVECGPTRTHFSVVGECEDCKGSSISKLISFDGKAAVAYENSPHVRIFNEQHEEAVLVGHTEPVSLLAVADDVIVTGSLDGSVRVYRRAQPHDLILHIDRGPDLPSCAAVRAGAERLLAVGGRSSVIIYSLLRAVALCEIETGARSLTALSFVDEELVGVDFPEDGVPQTILLS